MAYGEVCGAVAGAIMVIGLKLADSKEAYTTALTYELTAQFLNTFKSSVGSVCCRDLIGFDFSALEDERKILNQDRNLYKNCPNFVKTATNILEDILTSHDEMC